MISSVSSTRVWATLVAELNPEPVMVTPVPTVPLAGVKPRTAGAVTTV